MPRGTTFGEHPIKHWCCNSSTPLHTPGCDQIQVPPAIRLDRLVKATEANPSAPKPLLPTDAKERKKIPLYSGLVKYFPDALIAVAALSQVGSDQHHPGQPLHWERDKSTDHEDTLLRHLMESGTVDVDGVRHSTKVAWRALAKLQLELEESRK